MLAVAQPSNLAPNWKGPRTRVSKTKVKPGKIRAMKGEANSQERNLTTIDVMLLLLRELGPATTTELRNHALQRNLMARVPLHGRKDEGICIDDEDDGQDNRKRGLFTGTMSRCYKNYHFTDEVGIRANSHWNDYVHSINEKGLAFLANRMNNYVPDDVVNELQLQLGLNKRVQRKPPKDAELIEAIERDRMEKALDAEFTTAVSKAIRGQHEHRIYLTGRERPFIWRSDRNVPIMLDETHHPFHGIFKRHAAEAALVRLKMRVRSDYDGGEGKPKALLIETRPTPVAVPKPIPAPAPESELAESVVAMQKLRTRPDHSAQATLPLVFVPPAGRLSQVEIVRVIKEGMRVASPGVFLSREKRIREGLIVAQNQIDAFIKRTLDVMTPVLILVDLPSYELRDPQNPYHYCAKPFLDYADLNGFSLELRVVSNGFTALYVEKPLAIPVP